jgi:hypothetical protein
MRSGAAASTGPGLILHGAALVGAAERPRFGSGFRHDGLPWRRKVARPCFMDGRILCRDEHGSEIAAAVAHLCRCFGSVSA